MMIPTYMKFTKCSPLGAPIAMKCLQCLTNIPSGPIADSKIINRLCANIACNSTNTSMVVGGEQ